MRKQLSSTPISVAATAGVGSPTERLPTHSFAVSSPAPSPRVRPRLPAMQMSPRRRFGPGGAGSSSMSSRDVSYKNDKLGHGILPSPRHRLRVDVKAAEERVATS